MRLVWVDADEDNKDQINKLIDELRELGWVRVRDKRSCGYTKDRPRKQWLMFAEDNVQILEKVGEYAQANPQSFVVLPDRLQHGEGNLVKVVGSIEAVAAINAKSHTSNQSLTLNPNQRLLIG